MSLTDALFGSLQDHAKRESASWDPSEGRRKKDWGDHIGDFFLQNGSALDKATKDAYVGSLEDNYESDIKRYGSVVGGEDVSNLARLSEKKLARRLAANKQLQGARSEAGATTGKDITEFEDLSTPEAVRARASKLIKDELDAKTTKKETTEQNRYDESIRRDDRIRSEGRLDRNLERQLSAENAKMQMQLEYSRLAQSDRQRTADRKDKAIMALLGGLGNLGAGFTI
jgi:hypothetical protein